MHAKPSRPITKSHPDALQALRIASVPCALAGCAQCRFLVDVVVPRSRHASLKGHRLA